MLRDIANEKSKDYPVRAAQWWLKHTELSRKSIDKLDQLNSELDSLLERSQSYVSSSK